MPSGYCILNMTAAAQLYSSILSLQISENHYSGEGNILAIRHTPGAIIVVSNHLSYFSINSNFKLTLGLVTV